MTSFINNSTKNGTLECYLVTHISTKIEYNNIFKEHTTLSFETFRNKFLSIEQNIVPELYKYVMDANYLYNIFGVVRGFYDGIPIYNFTINPNIQVYKVKLRGTYTENFCQSVRGISILPSFDEDGTITIFEEIDFNKILNLYLQGSNGCSLEIKNGIIQKYVSTYSSIIETNIIRTTYYFYNNRISRVIRTVTGKGDIEEYNIFILYSLLKHK